MSGILHRTAFYDTTGGFFRPLDWAIVQTELGAMVEPFLLGSRVPVDGNFVTGGFDFEDQISRVDILRRVDVHKFRDLINFGAAEPRMHGGVQIPRSGP